MKKLKYTEIFILPVLIIILISSLLIFNNLSISSKKSSIAQLPTPEEYVIKLTEAGVTTKDSMLLYTESMLQMIENTFNSTISSLVTTRNSLIFTLIVVIAWLINSIIIYRKIRVTNNALTKSSNLTKNR